jgi:RNA 3'-terminal phosphate cyclase
MGTIKIDGSYGEGGRQIVRTACGFALIAQKACRIFNIRRS